MKFLLPADLLNIINLVEFELFGLNFLYQIICLNPSGYIKLDPFLKCMVKISHFHCFININTLFSFCVFISITFFGRKKSWVGFIGSAIALYSNLFQLMVFHFGVI